MTAMSAKCLKTFLRIPSPISLLQSSKLSSTCNVLYRSHKNERNISFPEEAQEVEKHDGEKVVNVAVIGMPNAGKSTLINTVLKRRVLSVSKKCHTTRRKTVAVGIEGNTQIVFLDNPGFVTRQQINKYNLSVSFYNHPFESVKTSDVVVLLHDAADFHYRYKIAESVERTLEFANPETKMVLALNKVDQVKNKSELLNIARTLVNMKHKPSKMNRLSQAYEQFTSSKIRNVTEQSDELSVSKHDDETIETSRSDNRSRLKPNFEKVFMISAVNGSGVQDLKEYLLSCAVPSTWKYKTAYFTDQPLSELITLCAREKLLDFLSEEIPYKVRPEVESCIHRENGDLDVTIKLPCPRKRYASALMGPGGSTIRHLAKQTELALADALQQTVTVHYVIQSPELKKKR